MDITGDSRDLPMRKWSMAMLAVQKVVVERVVVASSEEETEDRQTEFVRTLSWELWPQYLWGKSGVHSISTTSTTKDHSYTTSFSNFRST
jgi:hypothetical protein